MSTPTLLPYGDRAVLVDLAGTDEVVAWADALRSDPPEGLGEVVPGGSTVLVVAAEGASVAALRAALEALRPGRAAASGRADGPLVEVPVRYDGPDLADVAGMTGLSPEEVVAAHTGQTWRVAFGGFAPGFGYLLGEDRRLRVPRRGRSRTAVPAGAVGLADDYTGIYPRESPGGWQLIGSTDLPMWDLRRDPPAVLAPGARVRFVEQR